MHKYGTHLKSRTRLYSIWIGIKSRCNNPNNTAYANYGGKGIAVCDEWIGSYVSFHNWALESGYSDNLSIDRINYNGDYEPRNCRWVSQKEQMRNTSRTVLLTLSGETMCLKDWCEKLNKPYPTIQNRIQRGWDIEKAVLTPIRKAKRGRV